jgi:hypothetical protein
MYHNICFQARNLIADSVPETWSDAVPSDIVRLFTVAVLATTVTAILQNTAAAAATPTSCHSWH